jgi:hypothetical protein
VALDGEYAYVISRGLHILSIADPENPIEIGSYDEFSWSAYDVDVSGSNAFVANYYGGLRVISVSDPENPIEVGFYDTPSAAMGVCADESYIYVTNGNYGLIILEYYGPTSIGDSKVGDFVIPKTFSLSQNYPNPFNPSTTIQYDIPKVSGTIPVKINAYDIRGRLIRKLVDQEKEPGRYQVHWDGGDEYRQQVSSGIYLYRIDAGEFVSTRKMVLVR